MSEELERLLWNLVSATREFADADRESDPRTSDKKAKAALKQTDDAVKELAKALASRGRSK